MNFMHSAPYASSDLQKRLPNVIIDLCCSNLAPEWSHKLRGLKSVVCYFRVQHHHINLKYTQTNVLETVSASIGAFVGTVCHIYDILFAPKLSGKRRLDRPFRWRLQSKLKT